LAGSRSMLPRPGSTSPVAKPIPDVSDTTVLQQSLDLQLLIAKASDKRKASAASKQVSNTTDPEILPAPLTVTPGKFDSFPSVEAAVRTCVPDNWPRIRTQLIENQSLMPGGEKVVAEISGQASSNPVMKPPIANLGPFWIYVAVHTLQDRFAVVPVVVDSGAAISGISGWEGILWDNPISAHPRQVSGLGGVLQLCSRKVSLNLNFIDGHDTVLVHHEKVDLYLFPSFSPHYSARE
jgi:hypothetical protein